MRIMTPDFEPRELTDIWTVLPRCRALGCHALVFGSGKARSTLPGQSREDGYRVLAGWMDDYILPACEEHQIRVLLEPLNPSICNFILSLEEGRVLREKCHRPLYLLADSLHLIGQESFASELRTNIAAVGHVHLSERDRKCPSDGLSEELKAFLSALKETAIRAI
jgi:sugar phosphate isomerase/epimerase